jgi:putative membrane protein
MREETVTAALLEAPLSAQWGETSAALGGETGHRRRGERILCRMLAASAGLFFVNVAYLALTGMHHRFLLGVFQVMPVLMVVGHASLSKGWRRGVFLASTCFLLGCFAEIFGVRYGLLFGGHYTYLDVDVSYFGVPLIIPVFWVIFIYTSHCLINTFLLFLGRKKPARGDRGGLGRLAALVALDGVLVVIIDIIMDPIMVKAGKWEWADGGPYFGVPLGNFLGWFILACIASGSFRALEYVRPRPEPDFPRRFHLVPAVSYGLALLGLIIYAIHIDMLPIIPVALALMGPVLAMNLALYSGLGRSRFAGRLRDFLGRVCRVQSANPACWRFERRRAATQGCPYMLNSGSAAKPVAALLADERVGFRGEVQPRRRSPDRLFRIPAGRLRPPAASPLAGPSSGRRAAGDRAGRRSVRDAG